MIDGTFPLCVLYYPAMDDRNSTPPYIIWDWNGTLLDDVDAAVSSLDRMLDARGLPRTTRAFYREHFGFPVRPFYALLGMDPDAEWDRICIEFHDNIASAPQAIRSDTIAALELARSHRVHQSILSALRQDLLLRDTARAGVQAFFDRIYGVDNLDGATKLSRGHDLMARLRADHAVGDSTRFYFIGDTLHDAEVGIAMGATPILVDGGHQTAERLAAAGCRVVPNLLAAVQAVLG